MLGIDVSHHNGNIDWNKVAKNIPKIDFAFIKASTGVGSRDPEFHNNSYGAHNAGVRMGYYHFASLNDYNVVNDATAEAKWFLDVIEVSPVPDLPLMLDLELESPKTQLNDAAVQLWVNTFFSTLQSNGWNNYALYSYTPFLNDHLPPNHTLGGIRLWIAAYTNNPAPRLPIGWNDYYIWQYSSQGSVSGIPGNVDLNKTKISI